MTNRTYTDLFALIEALAGVDDFSSAEESKILAMANRRLRQAYDACDVWPRYMRLDARPTTDGYIPYSYSVSGGTRTVSSATRDGTTVTITTGGADFDVTAGQYVVIAGLSGTVNPNGTYQVGSVDENEITYELDTTNTSTETYSGSGTVTPVSIPNVEMFIRLHDANPTINGAEEYNFYVDSNGANPIGNYPDFDGFWVTYKAIWDGPYISSSTDVPQEWFYYAAHATYADFLRMDGQTDKAVAEEMIAQNYLDTEIAKVNTQRNLNGLFRRFSTYTSRQSR